MKVIIMCNGECLNKHSNGGKYHGYNNPFNECVPMVGDIIEIGGRYLGDGEEYAERNCEGKQYIVNKRFFKTYETWNHGYTKQQVIIEVSEI